MKSVQTLHEVDQQSSILQDLHNSTVVKQSKDGRKVCRRQTRSQSRASGFALRIAVRSAKSIFGYVYFAQQSTILLWKKVPSSPCFGKQERNCSFSKGKRKGRSFCTVTKGTKNTEKGRGIPLPFSIPSPLTNGAGQTFRYALSFQQLQDRWKAKRYRLYKTRQMQFAETKKAFL